MMEELKLLTMTAVLTILVWAGADSMVNETSSVRVAFEVTPRADSDMVVELSPGVKGQIYELTVSGPRRAAEAVQARDRYQVRLPIDDRSSGTHSITLSRDMVKAALVEQWREFRKLRVLSIDPPNLSLIVDRMITAELDVTTRSLALPYEAPPQMKNSSVTVRLRQSVYEQIARGGQKPQLDISTELERQLRGRPPGRASTITVALDQRPFGPGAELAPSSIEVTATVKSQRDSAEVSAVPIRLLVGFGALDAQRQAVGRDGTPLTLVTRSIRVAGPPADIAKLLQGESKAFGFIQLKETDLQQMGTQRSWIPEYILPPNVELDEKVEPIDFTLVEVAVERDRTRR